MALFSSIIIISGIALGHKSPTHGDQIQTGIFIGEREGERSGSVQLLAHIMSLKMTPGGGWASVLLQDHFLHK